VGDEKNRGWLRGSLVDEPDAERDLIVD